MQDDGHGSGSSDFGALLRRHRLAAGLSQEALAERARVSLHGISALERGYRRTPQRETLSLLATALALRGEQRREFEKAAERPTYARRRDTSVTIGPWPSAATASLPFALKSFVGRDVEIDEIALLMREHRLVTLTGAGGVGKTQTALHAATALHDPADTAVCFVGLASIDSGLLVTAAMASSFGVQEVPQRPLLSTLAAHLKDKSLLLILDSCEHVIREVARDAEALLQNCHGIRILATSREPLRIAGERTYQLASLDLPEACELFEDRAQAVDARFTLTDKNAPIVRDICRRLDGIPLAIELAAARVNVLSVTKLAEKLDDRFRLLVGGERTALPRQQTMRATIEWSYESLSEPEKRLFERLSIFVGGCTLAVATAVCATDGVPPADVLDLLASLVSKSLVLPNLDSSPSRYWMLESFREYARDRLVERGELWTVAHRHALAALESAQWFNRAFEYVHTSRISAQANYEAANWRSALHWALVERGDVVLGQRIAGELGPYFSFFLATTRHTLFFSHAEGRRWIDTALELAGAQTPRAAFAALKYAAARIAGNLREYGAELKASQIVLDRFGELGDALGVARAEVLRGHALIYLGRSAEAKSSLEPALRAARELGERGSFSVACLMRLLALATESDVLAARGLIAQALQIHRSLGHVSSIAYALLDLSECEFMAGNPELALAHAAQSLAAAPDGNMYAKCSALYGTSLYLQALSRYDEALASVREALDIACEHRFQVYVAWSVEHTATIAVLRPGLPAQRRGHVCARAAQIFGFADARLATLGSARLPFVKPRHAALAGVLRDVLGADLVAELMMQGAAMTEEKAVETAFALARETAT